MKTNNKLNFLSAFAVSLMAVFQISAQDYIVIAKDGNVYDEANAKYITVNQNNDDVAVIPGMVFSTTEHTPGWYKIQYSPGLHAFIPEGITASSLKSVTSGTYDIINNPGHKLNVQGSGEDWSANADGKSFKGKQNGNIIVFFDNNNNLIYSIVDIGNGPIAISYDNSLTKFF